MSDQLGDVDGALDSIETQLTDASSIKALASSTMTDDLQQRASTAFVGGDVSELTSVASATAERLREASQIDSVIEETSHELSTVVEEITPVINQATESAEQVSQMAQDVHNAASQSKAAIKLSEETAKLTDGFSTESSEGALGALQKTKIDDATVRQKASEVATKVLASKLLDGALFESAFADALSSAKNTDIRSVVAPVAKACADFAKAWLDEASQVGFSKLPPEVAVRALEDGVTSAADALSSHPMSWLDGGCWRSPSRRTVLMGYLPRLPCLIPTISRNGRLDTLSIVRRPRNS